MIVHIKSLTTGRFSKKKQILYAIIILSVLNLSLYVNTIHHDFLKDDYPLIVENSRLKDFQTFWNSMGSKFFTFPDFPYLHYWRPLSLFSFYLDHQVWGLNPSGYHLFNILINTGNAILVFLIFYYWIKKIHYAFWGAFGFSIHPSHVEAVSWISGRTDLLSAFFICAASLFFILFLEKKKPYFYVTSALFFILALLSKENSIVFPLLVTGMMFLYSVNEEKIRIPPATLIPGTPPKFRPAGSLLNKFLVILPFLTIGIIFLIIHNRFSGAAREIARFSLQDIFIIIKAIGVYTKIILTPFFPAPHFSMPLFDRNHLEFLGYAALAACILMLLLLNRKAYRYSICSLFFLAFLLPVLDPKIVPSYPQIAIRFAYIPAVFVGIFAVDTFHFFKSRRLKNYYVGLLMVIALIWGMESYGFQIYFKDSDNHYDRLIRYYPDDCSLLLPLALTTAQKRNYHQALALTNQALKVNDKNRWLDVSEMGGLLKANLLVITGRLETGRTLAEKILKKSFMKETWYFGNLVLSKYYEKKGNMAMALDRLKKAERIGETADLFFKLAMMYGKMSNHAKAIYYVEKAIDFNPSVKIYHELRYLMRQQQKR